MQSEKNICNEKLFSDFFKNHAKGLRNFLYYKFGNAEQADDATQEAFIKLWQNCKNVPFEKAKSYLFTVASNHSLNVIAHEKVVLNFEKKHQLPTKTNESPEHILEQKQFEKKLLNAIENINETQRIAFLMHRIDGKKYAEIASILNISVKAVEKRIHLALLSIKEEIENFR
jgi:RNA polymerase sigma-70 factor (ECF subfamily)